MVIVTTNWRIWLAGMAASLVIFAVVFFTVIQPAQNTASQAVKSGLQQTQQVIKQAQQQVSNSGGPASSAGQQALNNAQKLTTCLAAAGTDVTQLEACHTKYSN
jgi:type II secretory pathway component PulM